MSGDRSKIVERIRKLLALADDKGATEAEAVAAVMMAQRLMAENDVADWELHSMDEQPIATAESEPVRRRWRWTLADAISSNFRCRYYQNRKRCAPTGWKTEYRMIFYGYESDAKAAALAMPLPAKEVCQNTAKTEPASRVLKEDRTAEYIRFLEYGA